MEDVAVDVVDVTYEINDWKATRRPPETNTLNSWWVPCAFAE
jgi:hypothetical protein